ncbi:hypothetical protein ANN_10308 [Periplaneta americana]|uniref:Uncharacterized protein n=1 Tax=Periplaneta americana TaxID=6978 RepID=A0ABQ8TRT9_PERAM|nr:hypothetical protein ANN_10308 [Periplaneta americana]
MSIYMPNLESGHKGKILKEGDSIQCCGLNFGEAQWLERLLLPGRKLLAGRHANNGHVIRRCRNTNMQALSPQQGCESGVRVPPRLKQGENTVSTPSRAALHGGQSAENSTESVRSYARVIDGFRRNYPDVAVPNNSASVVYIDIIIQFIALLNNDERDCWFQQDSAICHTSNETMQFLCESIGERIISQGLWPPRSPDLTSPDFFLWGYLKGRAYKNRPHTLEELKRNITTEINNINVRVLKKTWLFIKNQVVKTVVNDTQNLNSLPNLTGSRAGGEWRQQKWYDRTATMDKNLSRILGSQMFEKDRPFAGLIHLYLDDLAPTC